MSLVKLCPFKPQGEGSKLVGLGGTALSGPPNACDGLRCALWISFIDPQTKQPTGGACTIAYGARATEQVSLAVQNLESVVRIAAQSAGLLHIADNEVRPGPAPMSGGKVS